VQSRWSIGTYDELWVDGRASYKVGSMIEEGG
jgi:hypothetical protein